MSQTEVTDSLVSILSIEDLTVSFEHEDGHTLALDGLSFSLKKGETIGIVGESGSGKSVTALSIMKLLNTPPAQIEKGKIWFQSRKLGKLNLLQASKSQLYHVRGCEIGMIFQEPMTSLNPVMTCGEQVAETLIFHLQYTKEAAKKRTLELFEEVNLPRPEVLYRSYPHQLSGGQKQRVMIAMAIACKPDIIIADEPTTALDTTVQDRIMQLLKKINVQYGTSLIFITHDLGLISTIADRVLVMYHGKVVEQGLVFNVFSHPKHPYTKALLACKPRTDIKLRMLPMISDLLDKKIDGSLVEKNTTLSTLLEQNWLPKSDQTKRASYLYKQFPILIVNKLCVHFPIKKGIFNQIEGYVKAVDEVSFEVYPGETLGLVGESGCGKTTLGRTILKLLEPTSGEIIFQGKKISTLDKQGMRSFRKDMQIIFQDPYSSLNPRLTVGDSLLEAMRVHKVGRNEKARKQRAELLLEKVGLNKRYFERYPYQFSGGQRQRICIARALSVNPKCIICDESVSALDVSVQAQVLNLLNQLKQEFDFTFIFISHDLSVVKYMSDRIMVMEKGKLVELQSSDALFTNPKTEYTQKLLASIPTTEFDSIEVKHIIRKLQESET